MRRMNSWIGRFGVSAVVLATLAGGTLAQESAKPDPVLRGPQVKDNAPPGQRSTFTGKGQRGQMAQRPVPQPVFMKAVMTLNADGAPAETRLSDEQAEKLRTIEQEFRAQQRDFAQAHREEVKALAGKLPPEDRARVRELIAAGAGREGPGGAQKVKKVPGKKPDGKGGPDNARRPDGPPPDDMMDAVDQPKGAKPSEAEVAEARAKLKELFEQAPKLEQARAKMWGVLSDPQRKLVEAELTKAREEMAAKAVEQNKQRKAADADGGKSINLDDPRIPEKARERLKNLPPGQREEALKRLQERRQNEQGKRPGGKKPPPPVDEVNIPAPDEPK